jgi:hypothetical protein
MDNVIKRYKEFNILLKIDEQGKRLWMQIETNQNRKGKYESVSWFVDPPNFIERLFGMTWQDKIARREKKLFMELFKKLKQSDNAELQAEIGKWFE